MAAHLFNLFYPEFGFSSFTSASDTFGLRVGRCVSGVCVLLVFAVDFYVVVTSGRTIIWNRTFTIVRAGAARSMTATWKQVAQSSVAQRTSTRPGIGAFLSA